MLEHGFVLRMKVEECRENICHLMEQLEEIEKSSKNLQENGVTTTQLNNIRTHLLDQIEKSLKMIREYKSTTHYYY